MCAGVSVQTLYDSIGSKADLVRRLNDLVDIEANVGEIAATVGTDLPPLATCAFKVRNASVVSRRETASTAAMRS